jgi:hypothetical protein
MKYLGNLVIDIELHDFVVCVIQVSPKKEKKTKSFIFCFSTSLWLVMAVFSLGNGLLKGGIYAVAEWFA